MSDEQMDKLRLFVQTVDEVSGHLSVEFACDGKPVLATDFAKILEHTAKYLEAVDRSMTEDKKQRCRWAIIEANIIGDQASFTLKGYDKEAFAVKKDAKE
jgi:hypothetical protein